MPNGSSLVIIFAFAGAILGALAAVQFNLAGLVWKDGLLKTPFWEPVESDITVFLGIICFIGWLLSIVTIVIMSNVREPEGRERLLGTSLACASVITVASLHLFLLVLSPAKYSWYPLI